MYGKGKIKAELSRCLDRRQLLTTAAAAVTVAGIVPTRPTEIATPALNPAPTPLSDVPALNVCAATARRIEEIVARNRIRHEARLPLLSIPKELRKMKMVDDAPEFERFAAHHTEAVWEEVLGPVQEANGNPHWRPAGMMEGLGYQARVSKILHERFIAQQRF